MKRTISLLLTVFLMVNCLGCVTAFASGNPQAVVSVSPSTIESGVDVTVSVTMPESLTNLTTMGIQISYDEDAFSIKETSGGFSLSESETPGVGKGTWISTDDINGDDVSGKKYDFVFSSKADALGGDYVFDVQFLAEETFDAEFYAVEIDAGMVTVSVTSPYVEHEHDWSDEYSKDDTHHWYDCSGCDEVDGKEEHEWDEGVETRPATESTEGVKTYTCRDCGKTKTEAIEPGNPDEPSEPEEPGDIFPGGTEMGGIILGGAIMGMIIGDNEPAMMPEKKASGIIGMYSDYATGIFTDVTKADWFYNDVTALAAKGVVSGYPDGSFRPQGEVTWGEALKLVMKAVGYGDIDPTNGHWASGFMAMAIEKGLIPGEVELDAAITRGEIAELTKAAMKLGEALSASPFADEAPASAVALYEAGIINGSLDNGQLLYRAGSTITRAEMAAIIWRVYCAR